MTDPFEQVRRDLQAQVNSGKIQPEGHTWTTEQLTQEFKVLGFAAPFVVVERKTDGVRGTLMFQHRPRLYFSFVPD